MLFLFIKTKNENILVKVFEPQAQKAWVESLGRKLGHNLGKLIYFIVNLAVLFIAV